MLIYDGMEKCCYVNRAIVDDAFGSTTEVLTDGAQFDAYVIKNMTTEAQIAEKQGILEMYTVAVKKGTMLEYNNLIKRLSDNLILRVTSNTRDSEAPAASTVKIAKVTAEKWVNSNA